MHKGGRRKDPVWDNFEKITNQDGTIQAVCKNCKHVQSAKACRMRAHIKVCVKEEMCVETKSIVDIELESSPTKKAKIQGNIDSYLCKTSDGTKKVLDKLVAKFFYACNIPFVAAEHEQFLNLVKGLRPGYTPPSRRALAEGLLDTIYDEMQDEMKTKLKGKEVTLMVDGWSNIHNEPITVACVQMEGQPYVIDAIDTAANKKTADYLTEECGKIIHQVKVKYECSIRSIVTDNARNMEKMRHQLEQADENILFSYGCSAHWLNLLGQDITPASITKCIVHVQKYFRNHHAPCAWLRECSDSVKPQLPGDTRWNSQITCMKTYLRNHSFYVKIVNEHIEEIDENVVKYIRDFNLYRQVRDLVNQLQPICDALQSLQSDCATIAEACHIWFGLMVEKDLMPHHEKLQERLSKAILPFHIAAYLLHPKYRGQRLDHLQKETARQWIKSRDEEMLTSLILFETESHPFPDSYFTASVRQQLDPVKWWKGVKKATSVSSQFCELAISLLSAPASSAGIESVFFIFAHSF